MVSGISTVTTRLLFGLTVLRISRDDYWCLHALNCCLPSCWSAGSGFLC